MMEHIGIVLGGAGTVASGLILWGLKSLIKAVFDNTVAVKFLTEKMDTILKNQEKIPKLEKDVQEAHSKIRELRIGLKS